MALTQISTDGIKNGTITGSDLATNVDLVDNQKLRLGTGNDLQIYHDGSNSYIKDDGTGAVILQTNKLQIQNTAAGEDLAKFTQNAAVELYYDNSKKFETTSDGVKISGAEGVEAILTFEPDEGDNASDKFRFRASDSAGFFLENGSSNDTSIKANFNGSVELYHANSKKLNTNANGVHITDTLTFANTGDSVLLADNQKVSCGNGGDLKIYHDGSNSYIQDTDQGNLFIEASAVLIRKNGTTENIAKFIQDGAVELYHDNSLKLYTMSSGVTVSGDLLSSSNVKVNDNGNLIAGSGNDLQIYHDGTHSYIANSTNNLYVNAPNFFHLGVSNGGEKYLTATENGAVELYHDNTKRFETSSVGASIPDSGNQTASSAHTTGALFCNLIRPVTANNNSYTGTYFMNRNAVGDGIKSVGIVETGLRVGNFSSDLSATEKIKLTYDGKILVNTNSDHNNSRIHCVGHSTGSHTNIRCTDSAGNQLLLLRNDGPFFVSAVHSQTTSAGANVNVQSNGNIVRSTSSVRYKKDITDATWGLTEVLKLKPKTFKNNAKDEYADEKTYGGFTAEDIHNLGLTEFVEYDKDNQPDALFYGNMVALMAKAIQDLNAKVEALEAK